MGEFWNADPRKVQAMHVHWPKPEPRSLRRLALSIRAQYEGLSRGARLERRLRHLLPRLLRDYRWSLWLALPCFGIAFLPVGWGFGPFSKPQTATSYLGRLWQVEAAALALALAVVIFIFQAVYSRTPRPALRDLAEKIFLPALFYSGLFGIGLIGVVLLGGGRHAPGGWAATWALFWSAFLALGLIALFFQMLNVIEPDRLYRHWLESIEDETNKHVEIDVLRRIAAAALKQVCDDDGLQFLPMFGASVAPHLDEITAQRAGVVTDISLRRVRRAGRMSGETQVAITHGGEQPVVSVGLGDRVGKGTVLMRLARVVHQWVGPTKVFKIKPAPTEVELHNLLDDLHDEALRLIRSGSPSAYRRLNEVYERLLLVHPETWARYNQQYVAGLATGLGLLEWTTLDRVARAIGDEIEQAVRSGNSAIAQEALNLTIQVSVRASALDRPATGLIERMLGLFVFGVTEVIRT